MQADSETRIRWSLSIRRRTGNYVRCESITRSRAVEPAEFILNREEVISYIFCFDLIIPSRQWSKELQLNASVVSVISLIYHKLQPIWLIAILNRLLKWSERRNNNNNNNDNDNDNDSDNNDNNNNNNNNNNQSYKNNENMNNRANNKTKPKTKY